MTPTTTGSELLDEHLRIAGPGRVAELARLLGVSDQAIWTWRRGKRTPGEEFWEPLRVLCGIPTDAWLSADERARRARLQRLCMDWGA